MIKRIKTILKKNQFEHVAWNNHHLICGIDEAGRGSFAGPVVAAAVILPPKKAPSFLEDSKKMTETARHTAFKWIQEHCFFAIGIVHHRYIDQYNIVQATKYAMKRAFLQVEQQIIIKDEISAIIVDAVHLATNDLGFPKPVYAFPFGEDASSSIAAASIVAKVTRDQLMKSLALLFPAYGFSKHKGYGTKGHRDLIVHAGASILHRKTYL